MSKKPAHPPAPHPGAIHQPPPAKPRGPARPPVYATRWFSGAELIAPVPAGQLGPAEREDERRIRVDDAQESNAPDHPRPNPGEYFPRWHHLSAAVLGAAEYRPCMFVCFDYTYWRVNGRRNSLPLAFGTVTGQRLREAIRKPPHNYRRVAACSAPTWGQVALPYSGQMRKGDVLLMAAGSGFGGHAVYVEGPGAVSHLLQAGSKTSFHSYRGGAPDGDQFKPIPISMVLELERRAVTTPLQDRFLPNVRVNQPYWDMAAMCRKDWALPFEVWRKGGEAGRFAGTWTERSARRPLDSVVLRQEDEVVTGEYHWRDPVYGRPDEVHEEVFEVAGRAVGPAFVGTYTYTGGGSFGYRRGVPFDLSFELTLDPAGDPAGDRLRHTGAVGIGTFGHVNMTYAR